MKILVTFGEVLLSENMSTHKLHNSMSYTRSIEGKTSPSLFIP